jgi:Fe2+ or Zn2+ uptake regulation protein
VTNAQKAILYAVTGTEGHRTAEQIFLAVKSLLPGIALGTVYRNLNQFAENKLIRRVSRANAPDYFERNLIPHDHMICVRCGRMSDFKISELKDYIEAHIGCPVISFDISVNCLCRQCTQAEECH